MFINSKESSHESLFPYSG